MCSLGLNSDEIWKNALQSKSGVKRLNERFQNEAGEFDYPIDFAGYIPSFSISDEILNEKEKPRFDLFIHYALHCAHSLLKKAQLESGVTYPAHRIGCILGVGMGGFPFIGENHAQFIQGKRARLNPFFIPSIIPNMAPGLIAMKLGLKGTNYSISSACASSGHAIEAGMNMIRSGQLDAIIVGGSEAIITKFTISGFHSMKALSRRDVAPDKASCPFDQDRDGFVMGEGTGLILLENEKLAKSRGAKALCELAGAGSSCDAYHTTTPHPESEGAIQSMKNALNDANIKPEEVDYINAHGTSTPRGDIGETIAIKNFFQKHAYDLNVSSTKSMTGHLLGAASGLESIFCIQSIINQVAPPTINLNNPSEECDLNYTPNVPVKRKIDIALNNSFGFGGTNSTLVFKRIKE